MSRIGNQPIQIPDGVNVNISGSEVTVKGPKGELSGAFSKDINITESDGNVLVTRPSDEAEHKAFHGLTRSLLANMVDGVNKGFEKDLELVGVGYRVQQTGKGITLNVMLSHTVVIQPPEGVTLDVTDNNKIKVSGIDKQKVGQLASEIRRVRPPNVYTGKGIRYAGEVVRIKPGKSARRA
jgi:large subunit ribosomal protein L6|tara:strand:- start:3002 stop:3544 length:543 start_codon:yes stop_codon:yes gene_type:complete